MTTLTRSGEVPCVKITLYEINVAQINIKSRDTEGHHTMPLSQEGHKIQRQLTDWALLIQAYLYYPQPLLGSRARIII